MVTSRLLESPLTEPISMGTTSCWVWKVLLPMATVRRSVCSSVRTCVTMYSSIFVMFQMKLPGKSAKFSSTKANTKYFHALTTNWSGHACISAVRVAINFLTYQCDACKTQQANSILLLKMRRLLSHVFDFFFFFFFFAKQLFMWKA